jgi:hypothetical protein
VPVVGTQERRVPKAAAMVDTLPKQNYYCAPLWFYLRLALLSA